MAKAIATCEPTEGTIGSAWAWDITYPDFPADESWELNYYLRGPSDLDLAWGTEVTAASSGPGFEVRVPATATDDITAAGKYQLIGRVTKAGDAHNGEIVYNRHFLVLADPATAVDAKSFNRQMLEAIDTALLAGISTSAETLEITVNGRTVRYRDREKLESVRAHYAYLVAIEENPSASVVHAAEFVRG